MKIVQVAREPEVYVAVGDLPTALATGPVHTADAHLARQLPGWRAGEFLGARALLRSLLAELAPAARNTTVSHDESGRPVLPDWPELGVSLSHDGDHVAAAVGRHTRVGIDVQVPPDSVADTMVERCLRHHAPSLNQLGDTDRSAEFTWVWTVQEACVKAEGTGISGRPWAIDVPPGQRAGRWGDYRWVALREHSTTPLSCAYSTPNHVGKVRAS